mgnify:CR=1 FL=1
MRPESDIKNLLQNIFQCISPFLHFLLLFCLSVPSFPADSAGSASRIVLNFPYLSSIAQISFSCFSFAFSPRSWLAFLCSVCLGTSRIRAASDIFPCAASNACQSVFPHSSHRLTKRRAEFWNFFQAFRRLFPVRLLFQQKLSLDVFILEQGARLVHHAHAVNDHVFQLPDIAGPRIPEQSSIASGAMGFGCLPRACANREAQRAARAQCPNAFHAAVEPLWCIPVKVHAVL